MQSILDKAQTLMAASRAPLKYWDHALLTAAYLIMRSPNSMMTRPRMKFYAGKPQTCLTWFTFMPPGYTT
jgi:hypothetical protein